MMDIAKYMVTVLIISSVFNDMKSIGMHIIAILIIIIVLGGGLYLVRDKKEGA
jgi:hypothetical protein